MKKGYFVDGLYLSTVEIIAQNKLHKYYQS